MATIIGKPTLTIDGVEMPCTVIAFTASEKPYTDGLRKASGYTHVPRVSNGSFEGSFELTPELAEMLGWPPPKLWSADWWKCGDGPPEFTCDRNAPEWWELGDGPTDWDMAV